VSRLDETFARLRARNERALVAYLTADRSPKNLSELLAAAESFADRVQPLGQAIAALIGNS